MNNPFSTAISYFARVDFRDDRSLFGILQSDRLLGLYAIGKTGTGKTTLLHTLITQDIEHGRGICVMDIHGDMIESVQKSIPPHRLKDIIYVNLADPDQPWGYNPLRKVAPHLRHLIVSHIIETFNKIWGGNAWGVKLEHIFRNVLLTLLDQDAMSLSDLVPLLTDDEFRNRRLSKIQLDEVRRFWRDEYPKYSKSDILPVLNKMSSFLTIPTVKRFLTENKKQLVLSEIMNEGKILLVNLSKGAIGIDSSKLLGSILLGGLSASGFYRTHIEESKRRPFFIYLDEFHNYTTLTLVTMFSELRKYRIGFIIAHQYLNQLSTEIRDAVLGNIGTIVCFRVSYHDAKYMAQEFYPVFTAYDFISLANYSIYLRLMIDGKPSKPFSATTLKIPVS